MLWHFDDGVTAKDHHEYIRGVSSATSSRLTQMNTSNSRPHIHRVSREIGGSGARSHPVTSSRAPKMISTTPKPIAAMPPIFIHLA